MLNNISMCVSESTLISKVDWNRNSSGDAGLSTDIPLGCLSIEFTSGHRYQYNDVPLTIIESMVMSDSYGKFFHTNIRDKYTTYKEV